MKNKTGMKTNKMDLQRNPRTWKERAMRTALFTFHVSLFILLVGCDKDNTPIGELGNIDNAKRYTTTLPATDIQTVKITAGTFQMGSPISEPDRALSEIQHEVTLTKDFYMGKYPVTFEQYDAFCEATGRTKPSDHGWGRGNRPVIFVNWDDAMAYCAWLSEQTGQTWTLPTEAQWEYACRAGTTTPFSLGTAGDGNSLVSTQGNFWWRDPYDVTKNGTYTDRTKTPLKETQLVGSYSPNAWGLYDMHGNVYEWCNDWYGDYSNIPATDPTGPATGEYRVVRGGCWPFDAAYCRSASRCGGDPDYGSDDVGFRVVLVP